MAGDWIKMTVALATSPKVVRIVSAFDADKRPDRFRVVGALHAVWCLFDQHSVDGKLPGYTLKTVSEIIGWPGFAEAMACVDWLTETEKGVEIPEFETHNGAPAKRRAQESERKRIVRKTSAQDADKKRTREEKRRVINKTSLPQNFGISERVSKWASENGYTRLQERLESFIFSCQAHNYTYADWDAAFMGAIRKDWAKLNDQKTNGANHAGSGKYNPIKASREALARELAKESLGDAVAPQVLPALPGEVH